MFPAPTWHLMAILCTIITTAPWVPAAPPERTLRLDAVELVAGRETAGKPEFSLLRDGIEYHFASTENLAAFEKDPKRFEVADGGACGRMGPLSGVGDARRFAVHDGRIYFFASDGCRAGFLKDPARCIEHDDEKIFGSNDQVSSGRATMDRLVAWAGGVDRIRSLKTFRAAAARKETHGTTEYAVTNETVLAFPNRAFQKESWNESWFSTRSSPDGAMASSTRGDEPLAPSRARAFERTIARWPISLLKAYVDGTPGADCPGLIVIGDGQGTLADRPVEFVRLWLNGAALRLTVDTERGTLLQLAYRGRGSTLHVGNCIRTFTAYATVEGLTLPTAFALTFDGKDQPASDSKLDTFEINPQLQENLFEVVK